MTCADLNITNEKYIKYCGLGGWLIVFFIHMLLWIVVGIYNYLDQLSQPIELLLYVVDFIPIGLLVLSLFFLQRAKNSFLAIYYLYTAYSYGAAIMVSAITKEYSYFTYCIYPTIWCIYFYFSKRVKVYLGKVIAPQPFYLVGKSLPPNVCEKLVTSALVKEKSSPNHNLDKRILGAFISSFTLDFFQSPTAASALSNYQTKYGDKDTQTVLYATVGLYLALNVAYHSKNQSLAKEILEVYQEANGKAFYNAVLGGYNNTAKCITEFKNANGSLDLDKLYASWLQALNVDYNSQLGVIIQLGSSDCLVALKDKFSSLYASK